ncbi:MAG: 1-deoxy-D-xylulose-5-phosphate synthase [Clostridium sp.]|nr:1-deoxy-D-xylulose-5-phosphate synthase [Clostridium sp.]MCM1443835.1 1-deoxy-D-xylulose-5-phosphate synthase [Candidatus Amulumruptor caecigallinarius]
MEIKNIKDPSFLKNYNKKQLENLCNDIRNFIIDNISQTGGHLASNLGVVELTVALHYVFDSSYDKFIFDVGHQSYTHKILTGRANLFSTLRQINGISGYQKRYESVHDPFEAGHSSTSIAASLGFAYARDLNNEKYDCIAIIGDGSLTGGLAFESLNNIQNLKSKIIIILNDNEMSISKNVGGLSEFLKNIRISNSYDFAKNKYKNFLSKTGVGTKVYNFSSKVKDKFKKKINHNIFTDLDIDYLGPIDGHNIKDLIRAFKKAKSSKKTILIHVITKKGKGYGPAELDSSTWHSVSSFDKNSGILANSNKTSISEVIANTIYEFMSNDEDIVTITPAMINGSKLEKIFEYFPNRSIDTGITESFATTLACSIALNNKKVFLPIYSSFLQRAYDNINHDIARLNAHVIIGIDRAGIVGEDGDTHHGIFDISFLNSIPNVIIAMGKDSEEIRNLLYTAFYKQTGPFCIRYERANLEFKKTPFKEIKVGTWVYLKKCKACKNTIISYGTDVVKIYDKFKDKNVNIINARYIKPIDKTILKELIKTHQKIYVYETSIKTNSLGTNILEYLSYKEAINKIKITGIDNLYVKHGNIDLLKKEINLDIDYIEKDIIKYFKLK